jgi:uncharacterized membrane protein YfhO
MRALFLSGSKRSHLFLAAATLLGVGLLVFRDFVFGNAILLFKDAGGDSVNWDYPIFSHFSDYLRFQGIPSWSFYCGMGQDLFYLVGFLILEPITWLPRDLIAPAVVFQHLAKVLLAGLFFFRFLQLRGLNLLSSILGSLLLCFSGYMCMATGWYLLADEVVCFTGILVAIESSLQGGRWLGLALAVALIGLIDAYHLYLCALFLLLYVPVRLFGHYGWQPRTLLVVALRLALVAVLGVGLGAVVTLPNLYALLDSPRGLGSASLVGTLCSFPILGLESSLHYATAILRFFGNDILGTAEAFRGWHNYLEAPLPYCGLLCLIILPQVFVQTTRRHQLIYAAFLTGVLLVTLFPWLRYLFWLFQGNYYRTVSLFSILGIIFLSSIAFSRYLSGDYLNIWVLGATTTLVIGTLYLPFDDFRNLIDPVRKSHVTILVLSYAGLLAAGKILKRPLWAGYIIGLVVVTELVVLDHITVSNRQTITKQELKERVGYNDATVDAIRDIKAGDNTSFYRITKTRGSGPAVKVSMNDSLIFGYYGTPSYSSFNNLNYINFLITVGLIAPNWEEATRWSIGLIDDPVLSLFAGEKYVLTEDPAPYQAMPYYEFLKRYEPDYLFRNSLYLPLGLAFSSSVSEDLFARLSSAEKSQALLRVVVVANSEEANKLGLTTMTLPELEEEITNSFLNDVVTARRNDALALTAFTQTRIEGKVALKQKAVLVIQTPFDQGWHAFQDGKIAPVVKVDGGLLGMGLDAGQHNIELRYRTPFLGLGLAVTLCSILVLAFGLWRWPRLTSFAAA